MEKIEYVNKKDHLPLTLSIDPVGYNKNTIATFRVYYYHYIIFATVYTSITIICVTLTTTWCGVKSVTDFLT